MSEQKQSANSHKVTIDRSLCCGYGVCVEECPEVFGLDEDGIVVLLKGEVGSDLFDKANEAAYACPQMVIKLEKIEN
ncbi:MAG: ferredoxin [Acidimicrobiales bacterium]|nr:ferredoxin [Hyphomonadaceae bacterium]RZV35599.1 MAG: ferredoxin [Acidimicrobiales bacterium]